jgi:hypothetical protein
MDKNKEICVVTTSKIENEIIKSIGNVPIEQMNHVAQRANSILQKPSPHSGIH